MGGMKDASPSLLYAIGLCFALCATASASDAIKVPISPLNTTIPLGRPLSIHASATGTINMRGNWLLNDRRGENSQVETISTTKLYKVSPAGESRSVKITAQSGTLTAAIANPWVATTGATTSSVQVSISPASASVPVKHSQQFRATVSGTSNTAVNWLVNGTLGGNSTVGTISSSGLYTAPAVIPSTSVRVTARSVAHPTASASAAVSVTVWVSISPTTASVPVKHSQQFRATVSGSSNTAVNWLVNGTLGGNSTVGTISSAGLYTAPAVAPSTSVRVTARSVAHPIASASAAVSVTQQSVSVAISPTSASVPVKHSQQFGATISGTSNTAVNWLVNGTLGGNSTVGTISSSGLYTAPAVVPATSVRVTARSVAQSTASADAAVSVTAQSVSVSISPLNVSLQVGQSQQFSATVSGASSGAVNWLVSGVWGGNSIVGTISTAGLYVAPQTVPTGAVIVTAQSVSNPTSSASASVSVNPPVSHSVSLSWTASSSSVVGYNVYRSGQSSGPFVKLNSSPDTATVYIDSAVVAGQTYYYVTTAVNSSGVESSYSNVAKAIVP